MQLELFPGIGSRIDEKNNVCTVRDEEEKKEGSLTKNNYKKVAWIH